MAAENDGVLGTGGNVAREHAGAIRALTHCPHQ